MWRERIAEAVVSVVLSDHLFLNMREEFPGTYSWGSEMPAGRNPV